MRRAYLPAMRMFFAGLTAAEVDDMEYADWRQYQVLTDAELARRGWARE